jgi:hypothetical protein
LRVKNTAYFDIAATLHQRTLGSFASPARCRLCAQDSTDKRAELMLAADVRSRRADQDTE